MRSEDVSSRQSLEGLGRLWLWGGWTLLPLFMFWTLAPSIAGAPFRRHSRRPRVRVQACPRGSARNGVCSAENERSGRLETAPRSLGFGASRARLPLLRAGRSPDLRSGLRRALPRA